MTTEPALTLNAWLRWDVIRAFLTKHPEITSVLEYGCGAGAAGARLAQGRRYIGVELDHESRRLASARIGDRGVVCERLQPGEGPFDLVCAFEVLEHIEDDVTALRDWFAHVEPGGWLALSVPAGSHRFAEADVMAGHVRRYDRDELTSRMTDAGLVDVTVWSVGMPFGYVLEWGRNLYARHLHADADQSASVRTGHSARILQPPTWAGMLTQALTYPARVAQRPFLASRLGTGLVAVGRRTDR